MPAPLELRELVERYYRNHKQYSSLEYKEAELRKEFIDPLFEMLGWDVSNRKGLAEQYKEVVHEPSQEVEGGTKVPDYAFRIGEVTKFFVEVKKPAVDIGQNQLPAFQLRRYAWSKKLPLSILTNFEDLAVYDGRFKPNKWDKPTAARVMHVTFQDLEERWDELSGIFSPDAIRKGLFDRYAQEEGKKRGTSEVDVEFLKDIEEWREGLAKNIALRNANLTIEELNFSVQRLIDRIVFLRICEDRGTEPIDQLKSIIEKGGIYRRLIDIFQQADAKYNSGLFHFQKDTNRAMPPDLLTPKLMVEDKILKDIIRNLYYPDSPYQFDVIPADILGQVYEQFLGKVIRLTEGHRAKVEEKPEVKKAGGVYYTPTYIVDYIVENTVGKLCKGESPAEMEKLRILDPACGSGSFLIVAYSRLLREHLNWYTANDPTKWKDAVFQGSKGEWRLTLLEKKRILLDNIYGVDIDSQAVEVTKLNLLLKALEGESKESVENVMKWFREPALPDLGNNIKCGNSLIDFGALHVFDELAEEKREVELARIKPFNWEDEFPAIVKRGGFDIVIGNPPWGADFSGSELAFLRNAHHEIIVRMIDSYLYFIHRCSKTLLNRGGKFGMIVPSTFLTQEDARLLRRFLIEHYGMEIVINLGDKVFGPEVLNTSTILVFSADDGRSLEGSIVVGDLRDCRQDEKPSRLKEVEPMNRKAWLQIALSNPSCAYFTLNLSGVSLFQKLAKSFPAFEKAIDGKIQRGVSPDYLGAHVIENKLAKRKMIEREILRPVVLGRHVSRYEDIHSSTSLIYLTRENDISKYPNARKHLLEYRGKITCKEVKKGKHPWFALHRPRNPAIFKSPKFVGLTTSKTICVALDEKEDYFATDALYLFGIKPNLGIQEQYVLGILHSKCFQFLYQMNTQGEQRVIPQIKAAKLNALPFPIPDLSNPTDKMRHDRMVTLVGRMLKLHKDIQDANTPDAKTCIQRQMEATDKEINALVYELYGLTEEETKIVDG